MVIQSKRSLFNASRQCKTIAIIENQLQFARALENSQLSAVVLKHCNLFDFAMSFERARQQELSVYVYVDHIDGIQSDQAGLRYLLDHCYVTGIISIHPRTLSLGKSLGLETIQRIFAVDSTGLEVALESVDRQYVDYLDIAPALVIPYIANYKPSLFPLPFVASGLVNTHQQIQTVLRAGALGVMVSRPELWS